MSTAINHNILSLTAQRNLWNTQNALDQAVTRLSSGLRINNSWDDPAGLAVSERFKAQISSMDEAERNANYDINLMQTAEGALSVIDEKMVRLRALAIEASNGALTDTDRASLDTEFQQLVSEINRIALVTNYNGLHLLDGTYSSTGIKFHIGTYNVADQDYYYVKFNAMTSAALNINNIDVLDTSAAQNAINFLDSAIQSKDTERTRIGAYVERLQGTIEQIQIARENATSSQSQIADADIAAEMSNYVKAQILMQTGVSMLAQANMVPQMIAKLVQ